MMEVFAAFVTRLDHHIGRLRTYLETIGERENTIVSMISDNGATAEGGPNGSWNQLRHYISDDDDDDDDLRDQFAHIPAVGVTITLDPSTPRPLDLDAELARVLRHQ